MNLEIDHRYPSVQMLRKRAKQKIPGFAMDYLEGGCNNEINLDRNTSDIREVQLKPQYLHDFNEASLKTTLFGAEYDAPFGVAPVGLQGMMWPKAAEILAKAAFDHNIPFVMSTVTTSEIETIGKITEGKSWFQLYHPRDNDLRDKLLKRCLDVGMDKLILTIDVPAFGYRPMEIRNRLVIPPKITFRNIIQVMGKPAWAIHTLLKGIPEFKTIKPYIPKGTNLKHLGLFMKKNFTGRLSVQMIKEIRDRWPGKVIVKGVSNEIDAEKVVSIGCDGIIVSNHGGRQLDHGQSSIHAFMGLYEKYKGKIPMMLDSGIRSGTEIANVIASGADFCFLGRTMHYGVGALGKKGGNHVISMLKLQLIQIMEQLGVEKIEDIHKCKI